MRGMKQLQEAELYSHVKSARHLSLPVGSCPEPSNPHTQPPTLQLHKPQHNSSQTYSVKDSPAIQRQASGSSRSA